ncbi:MAG: Uma2 family endonuclease [Cyanobacteria bacterium P01_D01_bin.73]
MVQARPQTDVVYPESDGQPMANNTVQFEWIVALKQNLDRLHLPDTEIFVAGDLFWYPVEGRADICVAPDVLVAIGRPKGKRGSYQQWREDNIAPQIIFEIISPSNTVQEMARKVRFFQTYGTQEYYVYDPEQNTFDVFQREGDRLVGGSAPDEWVSQLLGIKFVRSPETLTVYHPNGEAFTTYQEECDRADQEQARADQESERADREQNRAEKLAAKLRALGMDPESLD